MISVDEALAILSQATSPLGIESCPLEEAAGRVLGGDIVSDVDWPPFDTSAMDGYAVALADVRLDRGVPERPATIAAGDAGGPPLAGMEAARVMTGAPIPEGTEAVIPVEDTRRENGRVYFTAVPAPGAHIRRRGESIGRGGVLLRAGTRLTPQGIALAALAGGARLEVQRRPRVTVIATGNELVDARVAPGPGQLRDSNGPMLLSLCRRQGWPAAQGARAPDEAAALEGLFAAAGSAGDVLVTSGGVSAGDFDLLPAAARASGFDLLFHGVALRPGKPIAVGRRGSTIWFGLPGNPVSSAVDFHLFVRFALDRMEGNARPGAPRLTARLARAWASPVPRETFRDAVLSCVDGCLTVESVATRGSHDLAAHARANALLRLPVGTQPRPKGTPVECVLIGEIGGGS